MSKGFFSRDESSVYINNLQPFFISLDQAMQHARGSQGTKYAMLCRVLCGTPGEHGYRSDPKAFLHLASSNSMEANCILTLLYCRSDSIDESTVLIPKMCQVYPEYIIELHSEEAG